MICAAVERCAGTGLRKWWVVANTQGAGTPVAGPDAIYLGEWFNGGERICAWQCRILTPCSRSSIRTATAG